MDDLLIMENNKVPQGRVSLVGMGRLGLRTGLNLMQTHRGGPEIIYAIDGQKVSVDDLIFRMYGAKIGEYKVEFLRKMAGDGFYKKIKPIPYNINSNNINLIQGDVVCIQIAGGNTLKTATSIIKYAHKIGSNTISTMGVFGIGEEKLIVRDISKIDNANPIVSFLKKEGIIDNHLLIGTGKLIRDWEPVTPYMLDKIAEVTTAEILKLLNKKYES